MCFIQPPYESLVQECDATDARLMNDGLAHITSISLQPDKPLSVCFRKYIFKKSYFSGKRNSIMRVIVVFLT